MAKSTTSVKKVSVKKAAAKVSVDKVIKPAKITKKTPVAKKVVTDTVKRVKPVSTSGKYQTVRQMMDEYFTTKKDKANYAEVETAMNKEFPDSKFNKAHYSWYRHHILNLGELGKRTK